MEVIYRETILQKVLGAMFDAKDAGRKIDYIYLTHKEWEEFRKETYGVFPAIKWEKFPHNIRCIACVWDGVRIMRRRTP